MPTKRIRLPAELKYPVRVTECHVESGAQVEQGDPVYTLQDASGRTGIVRAAATGQVIEGPVQVDTTFAEPNLVLGIKTAAETQPEPEMEEAQPSAEEQLASILERAETLENARSQSLGNFQFGLQLAMERNGVAASLARDMTEGANVTAFWKQANRRGQATETEKATPSTATGTSKEAAAPRAKAEGSARQSTAGQKAEPPRSTATTEDTSTQSRAMPVILVFMTLLAGCAVFYRLSVPLPDVSLRWLVVGALFVSMAVGIGLIFLLKFVFRMHISSKAFGVGYLGTIAIGIVAVLLPINPSGLPQLAVFSGPKWPEKTRQDMELSIFRDRDFLERSMADTPIDYGWEVCNGRDDDVFLAYTVKESYSWRTSGWYSLAPQQCMILRDRLYDGLAYLHASSGGQQVYPSAEQGVSIHRFCVDSAAFDLRGDPDWIFLGFGSSCVDPNKREISLGLVQLFQEAERVVIN